MDVSWLAGLHRNRKHGSKTLSAADLPNRKISYLAALEKRNSRYDAFIHLSHPLSLNDLLCEPPQWRLHSVSLLAPTKQGLTRLRASSSVCVFTFDFLVNSLHHPGPPVVQRRPDPEAGTPARFGRTKKEAKMEMPNIPPTTPKEMPIGIL